MTKPDYRQPVREADFADHLYQRLENQSTPLTPEVLQGLHRARTGALAQQKKTMESRGLPNVWKPAVPFTAAAVLALTVIHFNDFVPADEPRDADMDVELLFSEEGFQFYRDLEFYRWLANSDL